MCNISYQFVIIWYVLVTHFDSDYDEVENIISDYLKQKES